MTRLAWLSDTHWDHAGPNLRNDQAAALRESSDCCVITGDLSSGRRLALDLAEFQKVYRKRVYFVLGNHDSYGCGVAKSRLVAADLGDANPDLVWLGMGGVHRIGGTQLCGVDGWYDYNAGAIDGRLHIEMTDWRVIDEFKDAYSHYRCSMDSDPLVKVMQDTAYADTRRARVTLLKTDPNIPVIFATHVPPFAEASWHEGKMSGPGYLPFFTNISLGATLNNFAYGKPADYLTTLCGHSHGRGTYQASPSHVVHTAAAEYGKSMTERIFEL